MIVIDSNTVAAEETSDEIVGKGPVMRKALIDAKDTGGYGILLVTFKAGAKLNFHTGTVWCVDASGIAMAELRRDIPSTTIIGVVARCTPLVDLEAALETTRESLSGKLRPEIVEANVRAMERAYKECVKG